MNTLRLYFLLRRNTKLSERRNVMFESNQYGKLFTYIVLSFVALEFIALGTFFGWLGAKEQMPEMIFFLMPFMLFLDFTSRFAMQQTPLMLVKPYLLTPISKYAAIECFLIQQLLDVGNLFWLTLFLPYIFIVWCGGVTGLAALALLALLFLMVLVNSQWYLLVRTLINQSIFWWALPAVFYGSLVLPFFVLPDSYIDMILDTFEDIMEGAERRTEPFLELCRRFQKMLNAYAMFFKQEEFAPEREYRLVFRNPDKSRIQFREKEGFLLPYIVIDLSDEKQMPLTRVTVAPKNHVDLAKKGMSQYLDLLGYDVPVELSRLKLRY